MASCGHPRATHQWLLMGRPSLPFARPKTLQTLQTLQTLKTLQTLNNRKTFKTLTSHASSCSQQPPRATHQWLHMALWPLLHPTGSPGHTSILSYGRPSLPFARPKTLQTLQTLKTLQTLNNRKTLPLPALKSAVFCRLPALLQPTGSPGHTSILSYGRPSLPFARPKTLQTLQTLQTLKTLQTLNNRKTLPFASPQTLQTLKTLQTLQTLQTLKHRKTLKTLTWHASSCSQQPPRATHQWLLLATLAANRHPKATHQWLLMGIQICRFLPFASPLAANRQPRATHQ